MGNITQTRVSYGLISSGTHTNTNTNGDVAIGSSQSTKTLSDAHLVAYSLEIAFTASGQTCALNEATGVATAGTTGVLQVDTATCAGTVTGTGNAILTITGAQLASSPLAVSVPVVSGDVDTVWAAKALAALKSSAASDYYDFALPTSTSISITPRRWALNDSTLNLAIANGTSTGITPEPTSANTTASSGVWVFDGAGKDFEGDTLRTITKIRGILVESTSGQSQYVNDYITATLVGTGDAQLSSWGAALADPSTVALTANSNGARIKITIVGTA